MPYPAHGYDFYFCTSRIIKCLADTLANKCALTLRHRTPAVTTAGFWVSSLMAGLPVSASFLFSPSAICSTRQCVLCDGERPGIALMLVIIAGSELFTGYYHVPGRRASKQQAIISHGQMWAILPQTPLGNRCRNLSFVAPLYSWGGGSLLPVDTRQHRSLSRAGENHRARHSTVLQKARCAPAGLSGNLI